MARLYALSRLAKYARDSFEKRSEDITREALVILTKPSIEQEVRGITSPALSDLIVVTA